MKGHLFGPEHLLLYNCKGKATGTFCKSSCSAGGPGNGRGLECVVAFQWPESMRRDTCGEGYKRGFLNLEIHGFLFEPELPGPGQASHLTQHAGLARQGAPFSAALLWPPSFLWLPLRRFRLSSRRAASFAPWWILRILQDAPVGV